MKQMITIVAGILLTAGMAQAETRVGYVDMQKAIQATTVGKKAKADLEGEFNKKKKELEKKEADLKKMGEDMEKKKAVLSEEVLNKKQGEFQEEMMKYRDLVAKSQLEIQKKERDLTAPILEKMKDIIGKVAKEKKFSLVIEKTEQAVLFADSEVDLTNDVVQRFEKEK